MNDIADHKLAFMNFTSGVLGGGAQMEMKAPPKVLLVDDEPRMLSSLRELLRTSGYHLTSVGSGGEAVEHLENDNFDLLILDMGLPDMSGHEVMDFINTSNLGTTVIVVSGNSDIDSAIGALKRGAFDYLRKPYAPEELIKTVDNAIKQRALEADNLRYAWQINNSEKVYRYFVENSPDIIYTLNEEGLFTFVNDRAEQLLGLSREQILGKHYLELVHADDNELAHYVFKERRVNDRASRNVELRLKTSKNYCASRTFENSLLTVSFSSMGMYSLNQEKSNGEFLGTYGVARDVTERKRAEEIIAYQAYHDILTDLPNRVLFKDRLGLSIIQAERNKSKLAVMFIDLDRFKLVNDSLGHVKGDELLQQVAARLKGCLRRGDTLARMGGDEFILSIPDLWGSHDVMDIAKKFIDSLEKAFLLGNSEVRISASIGIAMYPEDGLTIDDLIRHADLAMYHVKAQGKNGYHFYDNSIIDASQHKLILEQDLRRALEHDELEMYYQPQVDVATGHIVAAEALMRWNHPERGFLAPGEFLTSAEESGLMIPISDWMLETVCSDLLELNASVKKPINVSLNLSPQYLDRGNFVAKLKSTLHRYDISPHQIEVEVTENIFIRNPEHAIEQFILLGQLGVSIAIDDFGTGYSSLAYLQRFAIHTLKIDQSFVQKIQWETTHSPIIMAIISIAKGLGLNVIAEGVETDIQAQYLERAGCKTMQGYLYHRPVAKNVLIQKLLQQDAEYLLNTYAVGPM